MGNQNVLIVLHEVKPNHMLDLFLYLSTFYTSGGNELQELYEELIFCYSYIDNLYIVLQLMTLLL